MPSTSRLYQEISWFINNQKLFCLDLSEQNTKKTKTVAIKRYSYFNFEKARDKLKSRLPTENNSWVTRLRYNKTDMDRNEDHFKDVLRTPPFKDFSVRSSAAQLKQE